MEVDLSSDIHLHITRTKNDEGDYFLGIMITHTDGLNENTSGVMGETIHYLFIRIWILVKSLAIVHLAIFFFMSYELLYILHY